MTAASSLCVCCVKPLHDGSCFGQRAQVTIANPLLVVERLLELDVCSAPWFISFPCCSGGRRAVAFLFLCSSTSCHEMNSNSYLPT